MRKLLLTLLMVTQVSFAHVDEQIVFHTQSVSCYGARLIDGTRRNCDELEQYLEQKARKTAHRELKYKCLDAISSKRSQLRRKKVRMHAFQLLDVQKGETTMLEKGYKFKLFGKANCKMRIY
jgi:hypothetical protein